MISIPLFSIQPHACSYLADKTAQTTFVHPSFPMTTETYAQLIAQGFRRNGSEVYTPQCANCSACIPVRIPIADFKPNRNQSRCLTKNRATEALIKPAIFEQQHYDLYCRYQRIKHPDSSMQYATSEEYLRFLSSAWCDTHFVEFTIAGQLVAVAVVDHFADALSAVYTFFDPDFAHYSLGVYAVLWQLNYAKQLKLDWLYLGYWIADCPKMSYKNQYQPLEIFRNDHWQRHHPEQGKDR
ncbi:MAG: arginyltransferase [Methylococcaceae bacterium]|nr:arginyltransferase [Methylococcaceae bacterium]